MHRVSACFMSHSVSILHLESHCKLGEPEHLRHYLLAKYAAEASKLRTKTVSVDTS